MFAQGARIRNRLDIEPIYGLPSEGRALAHINVQPQFCEDAAKIVEKSQFFLAFEDNLGVTPRHFHAHIVNPPRASRAHVVSLENLRQCDFLCQEAADVNIEVAFELLVKRHRFSAQMRRLVHQPIDFQFYRCVLFGVNARVAHVNVVGEKEPTHRV